MQRLMESTAELTCPRQLPIGSSRNLAGDTSPLEEAGTAADSHIAAVVANAGAGIPGGAGAAFQFRLAAATPGPCQPYGALAGRGCAPEGFVREPQLAAHYGSVHLPKAIAAHGAPVAVVPDLPKIMIQ